jgi:ribosomal protein L11 methyltransferase
VLLGAKIAYGVDIDPQALTATAMNAEKNSVQGRVIGLLAEEFQKQPVKADVLVANVLAKPLIDMAHHMVTLVAPNGLLGLSGILAEQADAVVIAYKPWVALDGKVQQEDWVRLTGAVS